MSRLMRGETPAPNLNPGAARTLRNWQRISPGMLSRIVRRVAYQTSGGFVFHAALDDRIEHVCEACFRRTGTGDRGDIPIPGHTHPVGLSLSNNYDCNAVYYIVDYLKIEMPTVYKRKNKELDRLMVLLFGKV